MGNKSICRSVMFGAIIGLSLGLFHFWPFTLVFMLLGGIVAVVISVITGHAINFLLVLVIEYLLMVSIMFIALYVHGRRNDKG